MTLWDMAVLAVVAVIFYFMLAISIAIAGFQSGKDNDQRIFWSAVMLSWPLLILLGIHNPWDKRS